MNKVQVDETTPFAHQDLRITVLLMKIVPGLYVEADTALPQVRSSRVLYIVKWKQVC